MPKWQGVPCTRAWRGADRGKFSPEIRESSRPIYGGWLLKKSEDGRRSVCFHACATFFVCRKKKREKRKPPPHHPRFVVRCCFTSADQRGGPRFFRAIGFVLIWRNQGKICTDKHRLLLREQSLPQPGACFIEPTARNQRGDTRFIRRRWKFYVSNSKT